MMVAALVVIASPSPAPGAPQPGVVLEAANFSTFAHGANVSADVLRAGPAPGPTVVDAEVAFSGAGVDSDDFDAGIFNEANIAIVPQPNAPDPLVNSDDKEVYGKGSGLEVGLLTDLPNNDLNQLVLGGRAEAGAQPAERSDGDPPVSATDTGLVQTDLLEVPGDPLIYAQALLAEAQGRWNSTNCILGQNLAFGRGQAAQAQLVDASSDANTPNLDGPIVSLDADFFGTADRAVADSQSFSYFVANSDGSYGIASETHMTFAPIELLRADPNLPAPITIEILGEWVFRAVATGKPGGASISYDVVGPSENPDTPIIRIWLGADDPNGVPTIEIKRGELFGDQGINVPANPLLDLTIGEDPRAIAAPNATPDPTSDPTIAADGTQASAAADLIRLDLLSPSAPLPGPQVAGLRIGHLEASAQVPVGGINCPGSVRITKDAPDDAQNVGFDFTVTCDDGTNTARTITGDGTAQVDFIKSGSLCTVHENPEAGFITRPDQQAGPVVTNGIHNVTFTNTRLPGSLTVTKDAPADGQGDSFEFQISCPGTSGSPFTRFVTGDGVTAPVDNIPAGTTCTVHEVTKLGYDSLPDQTTIIPSNQTANLTFVNQRVEPDDGSIQIVKDAPDDAQAETFGFTVTCPGAPNTTFDRVITGDGEAEIVAGIPEGTVCTVHENTTAGFVAQPDQTVTVEGDATRTVTFVNVRTTPLVGGDGDGDGDGDAGLVGGEPPAAAAGAAGAGAATPPAGTAVRGVVISRPESTPASAVQAQPSFTG